MKKYAIAGLALMLTATLLVGCGCTNQNMTPTTIPTTRPANTTVTTEPATSATTNPTATATTTPTTSTADRGNGGLDNTTGMTEGMTEGTTGTARQQNGTGANG